MKPYAYFNELKKPSWAPPAWLFGPVWTVLYILIVISFGKVFLSVWAREIPTMVALPFILNLIFNFAFTTIQFKLKNNYLAAVDVLLVLGTLIWILTLRSLGEAGLTWVIYAQIPYLLWVCFATVLQLKITWLNR
jgi:tryptophan-rich sensory protein